MRKLFPLNNFISFGVPNPIAEITKKSFMKLKDIIVVKMKHILFYKVFGTQIIVILGYLKLS